MASLNQIMDYIADKMTWKQYSQPSSPVSFGAVSTSLTDLVGANDTLKNASDVILEIGGQGTTNFAQLTFHNTGNEVYQSYDFIYDGTTSNAVSSSYSSEIEVRVNFSNGKVIGRQTMRKNSGTQFYLHRVYYR